MSIMTYYYVRSIYFTSFLFYFTKKNALYLTGIRICQLNVTELMIYLTKHRQFSYYVIFKYTVVVAKNKYYIKNGGSWQSLNKLLESYVFHNILQKYEIYVYKKVELALKLFIYLSICAPSNHQPSTVFDILY